MDLTALSDLNRLVRTRMLGGVGAGEGDLPGYPISTCPLWFHTQATLQNIPR